MDIKKSDYSNGGCEHSEVDGYACLALLHEGVVEWMYGTDKDIGLCECWIGRESARSRWWVNARRRLPPDNEKVFVYTPADGEIRVAWHICPSHDGQHEWQIASGINGCQALTQNVTHWMSMPKVPKGE
jgi:hypothetical protein